MTKTMPLPTTQRALKVYGPGDVRLQDGCPLPSLEDDQILVRMRCVAINPVDQKVLDLGPIVGATLGCEFSGDVVQVGPSVKNARVVVGAAVFGCVYGNHPGQPDNGAFAEYVAVPGDLVYLLPGHLSYQEGATLGVSLPTVAMSTYYPWKLPFPRVDYDASSPVQEDDDSRYVLVYGGSTTMGAMALQLLRASGLVPVCTCSPRHFAMVRALGAAAAFDHRDPACGEALRRRTRGALALALDCITDVASMRICYAALGAGGGRYMGLDPPPPRAHTRRDVRPDWTVVFTMFDRALDVGRPFGRPARPRDRAFAEGWYAATQPLVDAPGRLRPHPVDLDSGGGGLRGVVHGLGRMRAGDVSGVRLVYNLHADVA